jgi:hypothetical protein
VSQHLETVPVEINHGCEDEDEELETLLLEQGVERQYFSKLLLLIFHDAI